MLSFVFQVDGELGLFHTFLGGLVGCRPAGLIDNIVNLVQAFDMAGAELDSNTKKLSVSLIFGPCNGL